MLLSTRKPEWLAPLTEGKHACFFYTTKEEFLEVARFYLSESFSNLVEKALWILPPNTSLLRAKEELEMEIGISLKSLIRSRRLLMIPWDNWYGKEVSIQELLSLGRRILKDTLREGFSCLRILGAAPAKASPYWKEFLIYEETVARGLTKPKPFISLCAYSLMDTPTVAITSIAASHDLCLIHHGQDWEWLFNKEPTSNRSVSNNNSRLT